jgi:hypothetical protein
MRASARDLARTRWFDLTVRPDCHSVASRDGIGTWQVSARIGGRPTLLQGGRQPRGSAPGRLPDRGSCVTDDPHEPLPRNGGSRPVPDPTELTDRAIAKSLASVTQLIDGEVKNLVTRIDGAVALTNERFEAAEKLRIEQKKDTKDAVDAALSAAKEAVKEQTTASERSIDKSERATGEQLKQQQETFAKTAEGLADKIEDLKERVGRIESMKVGATESRTGLYATAAAVGGMILLGLAIVGFVIANSPRPV